MKRTVAVVTLGCSRNEVDSEELAGRLAADGWTLVDDVESAEVALVNTCGFIESAKKDSIDALLEANSLKGHGQKISDTPAPTNKLSRTSCCASLK